MDLTVCPPVTIQGNTDLCGTWTLYLFVLHLLNSDIQRYDIYRIFSQYTQSQRDELIMMFMYWIFKFKKFERIPGIKKTLLPGNLPSL